MAPRPATLTGKVVGLLDNGKAKSDILLGEVADMLRTQATVTEVVTIRKPSPYRPASDEQLDELARRVDVVIAGIGD
jgi:hypothetical protein